MALAAVALATGTAFLTPGFSAPAAALWDPAAARFYVADSDADEGWLSLADAEGRLSAGRWSAGFSKPAGMALSAGRLVVADGGHLALVDPATGAAAERVPVPGARRLCDASAASDGSVFASDPAVGVIWRLRPDGAVEEWAAGDRLEGPCGLRARGGRLYVASRGTAKVPGRLYWLDLRTKRRRDVSKAPLGRLAGLEPASGGGWLVTDPEAGKLWRVSDPQGEATLLDGALPGAGDIGYDPKRRLVVVPRSDGTVEGLKQDLLPR